MKRSKLIVLFFFMHFLNTVQVFAQESSLPANIAQNTLRDVKGPVNFPSNIALITVVAIVLLMAVLAALIRYLGGEKEEKKILSIDQRTPWEIAYDQFNELEKISLLQEGQFKAFYTRLSGIIRQYFENHFKVRAPEMTTEEFLRSLEQAQKLSDNQKVALKNFLNSCDIVKFAKHIPGIEEGRASFKFARELVDETRGDEERATAAADNKT